MNIEGLLYRHYTGNFRRVYLLMGVFPSSETELVRESCIYNHRSYQLLCGIQVLVEIELKSAVYNVLCTVIIDRRIRVILIMW